MNFKELNLFLPQNIYLLELHNVIFSAKSHHYFSLCSYIPSLTRILLPRVDPLVLISIAGFLAILVDHLIIQI